MKIKAITSAVLSGLLRPMLGDVNVVSAPVVAKERGMVVDEIVRAAQSDYESLITVTVTTERQERSVSGTVYHDGKPRLVDIKGIRVDAEFGKSMIYVTNEDKPGFIGSFAGLLGDAKINIATFHLGRVKQGGDAIALVEVDGAGARGRARQGAGAAAGQAGQGAGVLRRVHFPSGECLRLRRGPAAAKPHGSLKSRSNRLLSRRVSSTGRGGRIGASPSGERFRRESMRLIANSFVTTSLVVLTALAAGQARAADMDATSAVDAVTVYPDGASVTRVVTLDLPAGDNSAVLKDFPLTLDPSSLRVEGEAGAKLTIGAIDARPPRAAPPVNLPELDKRIEALKDERANLQGAIDAATARRKFAERFAEASPAGIGDKGEARPIAEWRAAFAAVGEEVATAETAIRDAERKQRELDREIARLEQDRAQKPPSKLEVRIELAAAAATKATLRVTYAVRNARWVPLYDARLDTGAKDRKPALELVRRAEITQTTGEDWSNVALAVSTVRTARGGSAPDLNSLIVQYPQPPRPSASVSARRDGQPRRTACGSSALQAPRRRSPSPRRPTSSRPRRKSAASR